MTGARLAEVQVALMLLTRLPAGRMRAPVPGLSAAVWAFPLVGAVVGVIGYLGYAIASAAGLSPAISAALAVAVAMAVTGALHEDGLADLADGIGGGRDPQRRLEIMRDSRIGSYGAIALVLAIGLRVLAVAEVGAGGGVLLAGFVAAAAASRGAMLVALGLMPAARADGLGRAAARPSAGRVTAGVVLAALAIVPLGPAAIAVVLAVAVAGGSVAALAAYRIGGQTGDVLGAIQVVSEVAAWLALAASTADAPA